MVTNKLRPPIYDRSGNLLKHLQYDRIDNYVYIGTTICCQYHLNLLIKKNIIADIDLEQEKMDKPSGVTAFLWLPTIDFTPPSQLQLFAGADFIHTLVKNKMKCYVHCNAGLGRAPTMVSAYYILHRGLTPKEAVKRIRKNRPRVSPNNKQMAALERFYKEVNK
ncbi:MAG: dual specificity protein phosphatase family protein [Candidatus Kerfeldbacteria bacterium]